VGKKAFTLVEILAIIIILGIILAVVVPSTFSIIKRAKETSYKTLVKTFKNDTKLYASKYPDAINEDLDNIGYYKVTLDDLNGDALLKTPVVDPRTDTSINLAKYIVITRNSDYSLTYCYEDEGCDIPESVEVPINDVKPIITLIGSKTISVNQGTIYTDLGATATDDVDGNITSKITVVNKVNMTVPGSYQVIYTVADSSGNKRIAVRSVTVIQVYVAYNETYADLTWYRWNDQGGGAGYIHTGTQQAGRCASCCSNCDESSNGHLGNNYTYVYPGSALLTALTGATIQSFEIYVYRDWGGYDLTETLNIYTHNQIYNTQSLQKNEAMASVSLARDESAWVSLPLANVATIVDGTRKGWVFVCDQLDNYQVFTATQVRVAYTK